MITKQTLAFVVLYQSISKYRNVYQCAVLSFLPREGEDDKELILSSVLFLEKSS